MKRICPQTPEEAKPPRYRLSWHARGTSPGLYECHWKLRAAQPGCGWKKGGCLPPAA